MHYTSWPEAGRSFDTALNVAILLATASPAILGRLYVGLKRSQPIDLTVIVFVAWVCLVFQSALLIAACYFGWGTAIDSLPSANVSKAEHLLFASNLFLVLAHGFSRACMLFTVARVQHRRTLATYVVLSMLGSWTVGSLLGFSLNRLSGPSYWVPVGQDLQFALWLVVYVAGLAVDLAVSAIGAHATVGLQMSVTMRVFINAVFSADVLVVVPAIYGLRYLRHQSSAITKDPTLHSAPFLVANQAALCVSMWCRFLEIAHGFRDEVGHATFGFGEKFSKGTSQRPNPYKYYGTDRGQKRSPFAPVRHQKQERAEDEIELAAYPNPNVAHDTRVESNGSQQEQWSEDGIMQQKSYHVEAVQASM